MSVHRLSCLWKRILQVRRCSWPIACNRSLPWWRTRLLTCDSAVGRFEMSIGLSATWGKEHNWPVMPQRYQALEVEEPLTNSGAPVTFSSRFQLPLEVLLLFFTELEVKGTWSQNWELISIISWKRDCSLHNRKLWHKKTEWLITVLGGVCVHVHIYSFVCSSKLVECIMRHNEHVFILTVLTQ